MVVLAVCASAFRAPTFPAAAPCTSGRGAGLLAKAKKGKKKKSKEPKTSGIAWARDFVVMPYDSTRLRELVEVATRAYESRCGKALHASLTAATDVPKALWKAPVAVTVVRNGTVTYANLAACEAFNVTHETLIGSATTLPDTLPKPFESSYGKKLGDSLTLEKAARWSVDKPSIVDGQLVQDFLGAGYAFASWKAPGIDEGEDDAVFLCEPGGLRTRVVDIEDLEAAVADQAAKVRRLKEVDGKANKDPEVAAAVAELLRLKGLLADSQ